jgi:hypothetical protein
MSRGEGKRQVITEVPWNHEKLNRKADQSMRLSHRKTTKTLNAEVVQALTPSFCNVLFRQSIGPLYRPAPEVDASPADLSAAMLTSGCVCNRTCPAEPQDQFVRAAGSYIDRILN